MGEVAEDIGTGSLVFDSSAGQIGHNVAIRQLLATAATFLWGRVVRPLSSGDGSRHLLRASA